MSTENRTPDSSASDMAEAASRNTLALNPLVGMQGQDLIEGNFNAVGGSALLRLGWKQRALAHQIFRHVGEK